MAKSYRGKKSRARSSGREEGKTPQSASRCKRFLEDEKSQDKRGSLNDISWYSRNPNLLAAAGSFPYPYRPGMTLPLAQQQQNKAMNLPTIPGIVRMDWVPSFGNSKTSLDPASIAGNEFYGRVRDSYAGALDADAPDFMVYIGALDSVFAYIGWLKRVYRAISTYSADNFALPEGLLTAFRIPRTQQVELRQNKIRFWQGINELILKSRKYRCPAVMDLFNRHYWMSDNVYADAPSVRAQLYVFNLIGVYQTQQVKEAATSDMVQGLVMVPIPTSPVANVDYVSQLISFGESLIQALDTWDDGYTISGYLMRAFEGVSSFTVAEILQDELITAQYVPEVLTQIENARAALWVPDSAYTTSAFLSQILVTQNVSTNAVISNVNVKYTPTAYWLPFNQALLDNLGSVGILPFLNSRMELPTVADNVIASRLQSNSTMSISNGEVTLDIVAGTEIVFMMWEVVHNGSSGWTDQIIFQMAPLGIKPTSGDPVSADAVLTSTLDISQFDWHPFIFAVSGLSNRITVIGDTNNPTVITREMLSNLHKICFYSEFNSFGI